MSFLIDNKVFLASQDSLEVMIRVFRFTSKLEFYFEAWAAHADRYERETDQKKIYRPINYRIPVIFVFNGNFNGEMARF